MKLVHSVLGFAFCFTKIVHAHGEPETPESLAQRHEFTAKASNVLARNCNARLDRRSEISRRSVITNTFVNKYRQSRGLHPSFKTRQESTATCVLTPKEELGPYYLQGELVRHDLRESEPGLDLLLDLEVLDVNTCAPIEGVMLDFWACNSTGVYSGYAKEGTDGLSYLRGLQPSDSDGIVQVLTKFPGWYTNRAQHIHIMAHVNYIVATDPVSGDQTIQIPNDVIHVGQLFFDQNVLTQINQLLPYITNNQSFTLNPNDGVLKRPELHTDGVDPYVDIALTGDTLEEGVVGRITIAIDPNPVIS